MSAQQPGPGHASAPGSGPIVELDGVGRDYGAGELVVHALRGVSLQIARGELAAIAGPSGSGKSTLFNIISGLDRATAGEVTVDGQRLSAMSRSRMSRLRLQRIGFVFQSYNLLPVLTAYENAEYVLMMQGVPAVERRQRVMALLQRVGLEGMERRFPRQLSGGQQQRVAIARAIAAEPALLLADEPTANLDSDSGASLMELLVQLNQERGITCLFATHDQSVMRRARRLLRLTDGQVTFDGSPEELFGARAE